MKLAVLAVVVPLCAQVPWRPGGTYPTNMPPIVAQGPLYKWGRVAVINSNGTLDGVTGATVSDCVRVDGSSGACGSGSGGTLTVTTGTGAPTATCSAPSPSALLMYSDTAASELWVCVAAGTGGTGWAKIPGLTAGSPVQYAGGTQVDPCGTVAAGQGCMWFDSAGLGLRYKNEAQVTLAPVVINSFCAAGYHVDGFSADGTKHCTADAGGGGTTIVDGGATSGHGHWCLTGVCVYSSGASVTTAANTVYGFELEPAPLFTLSHLVLNVSGTAGTHNIAWALIDTRTGTVAVRGHAVDCASCNLAIPATSAATYQLTAGVTYDLLVSADAASISLGALTNSAYVMNATGQNPRIFTCSQASGSWSSGLPGSGPISDGTCTKTAANALPIAALQRN